MLFTLERLTQPQIEPVSLAEARRQTRQYDDVTDDDADLEALITGAREWAEDYTGRALIDQTWRLSLGSNLPNWTDTNTVTPIWGRYCGTWNASSNGILLRKSPIIEITSIATVDAAGAVTALDIADYQVLDAGSKWPSIAAITGSTWAGGTLRIEYRAGFADRLGSPTQGAEMVPQVFKSAIRLHVEALYDRDEKMMEKLLEAAKCLIKAERAELQIA